ncbi:docking protein 1b isoform X1 [Scleropages formosus]|uniref:Docking protein 1b n=2 Tax=Scleropages formosus TaxID=113540 RepID=A0A8C9TNH9_SCLFO|nr:docking protein 1 isoform X1 [Scleropages formosus]
MDAHVKEGLLYVQHQKFGKKWKKSWFVLYPASQNGIARLEFFDCNNASEKPNTKKLDKKIIRLAECISIWPAVTETCPKENMSAFCVETNDKTHVFAAEKQTSAEWVEKMCELAFQGGSGSGSNGQQELKMAENLIYYSREEVNEFWVCVQRTEASERCGLQGSYWLKADSDSLVLKEPKTKRNLLVWPYKLLRRYGRDKVMFSFEAGRRCDSGPGNFTFETKQGNEIFGIVEAAIREQKAQAEEKHQSCPSLDLDCTAPQQNRSPTAEGSSDPDGDSGGSKPSSADGVFARRDGEGRNLKGRVLPDPPPPLTSTPPRSPLPRGPRSTLTLDDQSNLYSEPADSVRLPPSAVDGLYSDPVDSIKTPTPAPRGWSQGDEGTRHQGCKPDPLYSDIYDRVSVDLALRTGGLGLDARTRNGARQTEGARLEHIYDEPEGRGVSHGAGLYDEARLEPHAWRNRGLEEPFVGHEVPYNPNTDDYSVPAYNKPPLGPRGKGPKPLPAPKPTKGLVPRKEPPALPQGKLNTNVNNNNSGSSSDKHTDLYSQVSKHKHLSTTWYPKSNVHSPDVIYDNLGNI